MDLWFFLSIFLTTLSILPPPLRLVLLVLFLLFIRPALAFLGRHNFFLLFRIDIGGLTYIIFLVIWIAYFLITIFFLCRFNFRLFVLCRYNAGTFVVIFFFIRCGCPCILLYQLWCRREVLWARLSVVCLYGCNNKPQWWFCGLGSIVG